MTDTTYVEGVTDIVGGTTTLTDPDGWTVTRQLPFVIDGEPTPLHRLAVALINDDVRRADA